MNILFLNNAEISPLTNGIQRITHVLSKGFTEIMRANCYSAYFTANEMHPKTEFAGKIQLSRSNARDELGNFVRNNKIDVIICQQVVGDKNLFENIREACNARKKCRLLFCLHANPAYVYVRPNIRAEWFRAVHGIQRLKSLKKLAVGLLPASLYNYLVTKQARKEYTLYNELFDGVVLLSENFIDEYCEISGAAPEWRKKIFAIPNAFSFDTKFTSQSAGDKQPEVLIVSRLSDRQKRISEALEIWKKIEIQPAFADWKLRIVGTGEDELYYKSLTRKLNLKHVFWEGRQNPVDYYRKASIYMMTSAYEGFGLVLVEACQMGCVPVVFDMFGSVRDVIDDNRTGIVVPKGNLWQFAEKLSLLMLDDEKRAALMSEGLKYIEKFSVENIVSKWADLFDELKVEQE